MTKLLSLPQLNKATTTTTVTKRLAEQEMEQEKDVMEMVIIVLLENKLYSCVICLMCQLYLDRVINSEYIMIIMMIIVDIIMS